MHARRGNEFNNYFSEYIESCKTRRDLSPGPRTIWSRTSVHFNPRLTYEWWKNEKATYQQYQKFHYKLWEAKADRVMRLVLHVPISTVRSRDALVRLCAHFTNGCCRAQLFLAADEDKSWLNSVRIHDGSPSCPGTSQLAATKRSLARTHQHTHTKKNWGCSIWYQLPSKYDECKWKEYEIYF